MAYEHLTFSREMSLTDRHKKRGFPPSNKPDNPKAFGAGLRRTFDEARLPIDGDVAGYDDRILFKVQLSAGAMVPALGDIPGVELVSQEDKTVILAFANRQGLETFESRLSSLAREGKATRAELLYALEGFEHWTADDRKGAALLRYGFPEVEQFVLDVELWPLERADQRQTLFDAFLGSLGQQDIEQLDTLYQPSLVMVRVRCTKVQAEAFLLRHRDVRKVDLPPRTGVAIEVLLSDIQDIPPIERPREDLPAIAILDAGLSSGHPLLAGTVGDAQGYLEPARDPHDNPPHWHGTFVSGVALYGDVHECLMRGHFIPQLRLFSGKVFEDDGTDQTKFVEKAVEEAVIDLHKQYECKVFNLSYGDFNKVYDGRHVRGLAYTLDRLTRELGVLFVVPTGNLKLEQLPEDVSEIYPKYLYEEHARLLDPAPALSALTIGGLARHTATRDSQRYKDSIEDLPIAQEDQPFPLGRSGFSIGRAIKPDLVEHAGNVAIARAGGRARHKGLGVVSIGGDFASGRLFAEDVGTSYAAPQAAHRAARLLSEIPDASANMLRALLSVHARWPQASVDLLNPEKDAEGKEQLLRLVGYGRVDEEALYRSIDRVVTLLAEDSVANDKCHFYELPIPPCFWSRGKRQREIAIALAYSPDIRTTRLDYRMSKLWYTLVKARSLDEVEAAFKKDREKGIKEIGQNRWISSEARRAGTLQVSRWGFKMPPRNGEKLFVVVTRQDSPWGNVADGEEAYSLVSVISDRENAEANLYAEMRAQLEARARARARV